MSPLRVSQKSVVSPIRRKQQIFRKATKTTFLSFWSEYKNPFHVRNDIVKKIIMQNLLYYLITSSWIDLQPTKDISELPVCMENDKTCSSAMVVRFLVEEKWKQRWVAGSSWSERTKSTDRTRLHCPAGCLRPFLLWCTGTTDSLCLWVFSPSCTIGCSRQLRPRDYQWNPLMALLAFE